ncbi:MULTISPECIES: glycosyltransferase [unclassified Roseitalea]|uniref:glycosyltransferase n=1 Tax=unclassified Roseitalea TaxID=2639107 RepID=UPI00274013D9|nr:MULTISPECIES: glycosyltransferase [unclassified Roseitalea]
MRIVHVLRAPMGGVLRHVRDLARAQAEAGHAVGLVCDVQGTQGYDEAALEALAPKLALGLHRVRMARSIGFADIASARKILKILRRLGPDAVHGHGAKGGVYARAIGRLANRNAPPARLYSPHGGSLHYDPESTAGKVYFAIERLLERHCETILFVADHERAAYRAKIGAPRCATRVVHNGLTPAEFTPVLTAPDAADFLFIGEMRRLKGPDLFVDALAALSDGGKTSVSAVMVGAGPDRAAIEARIAEAGLGDVVALRPPMPARAAFALARTVVMPSRAEAMPYIVLEALAAGRPLIATDVGGIAEIMGGHGDALIAPTLPDLTAAMAAALDDPGALGRRMPPVDTLRQRFSTAAMAEAITNACREALLQARKSPDRAVKRAIEPRSSNVS